jgi:hypothetical protein
MSRPATQDDDRSDGRRAHSLNEAAHLLALSERGVYHGISNGDIRAVRIGGRIVVPAHEISRQPTARGGSVMAQGIPITKDLTGWRQPNGYLSALKRIENGNGGHARYLALQAAIAPLAAEVRFDGRTRCRSGRSVNPAPRLTVFDGFSLKICVASVGTISKMDCSNGYGGAPSRGNAGTHQTHPGPQNLATH